MKINQGDKKDNITFGILFFFIFLIISFYPLINNQPVRIWSFLISLLFLLVTIVKPNLFTFLNKLWIKFGIIIGKIVSPVVMGFIFFCIVTPTGLLVKLFKKDIMFLKKKKSTYWISRVNKSQDMKKQF